MADPRSSDSGVTLLEMLVVLTLIAVGAGVVTLALPSAAQDRTVTQEAGLLAARLNLAAERSLIERRQFRMDWTAHGYSFDEWSGADWQNAEGATLSGAHAFDRNAMLSGADGARRGSVTLTPDLLPPQAGLLELRLSAGTAVQSVIFDGVVARVKAAGP